MWGLQRSDRHDGTFISVRAFHLLPLWELGTHPPAPPPSDQLSYFLLLMPIDIQPALLRRLVSSPSPRWIVLSLFRDFASVAVSTPHYKPKLHSATAQYQVTKIVDTNVCTCNVCYIPCIALDILIIDVYRFRIHLRTPCLRLTLIYPVRIGIP